MCSQNARITTKANRKNRHIQIIQLLNTIQQKSIIPSGVIGMYDYLKRHENFINNALASSEEGIDWKNLQEFHLRQIGFIQHERLIHLLVTLFFGLFSLISILSIIIYGLMELLPLTMLFLVLLIPYIFHYFRLENGIQRWYGLYNQILVRSGKISTEYEKK